MLYSLLVLVMHGVSAPGGGFRFHGVGWREGIAPAAIAGNSRSKQDLCATAFPAIALATLDAGLGLECERKWRVM